MQLPGAKSPISPKVVAGANWSGYATLILTVLGFITPDMLTGLGHFAPLVYGVVVAATYAIGAYLKEDPARTAGLAAATAAGSSLKEAIAAAHTVVVNNPTAAPTPVEDPAAPPADPAPAETPAAPAATN